MIKPDAIEVKVEKNEAGALLCTAKLVVTAQTMVEPMEVFHAKHIPGFDAHLKETCGVLLISMLYGDLMQDLQRVVVNCRDVGDRAKVLDVLRKLHKLQADFAALCDGHEKVSRKDAKAQEVPTVGTVGE